MRQKDVSYELLKGGAPTSTARCAYDSIGVDEKAASGTFMAYLVYRKLDRPKSKTIYNLHRVSCRRMQVSATTGPNGTAFRPRLFTVTMSSPKEKRRLIYSVVTRKVYNYVFIEIFGDQGPSFRCKTQFSR